MRKVFFYGAISLDGFLAKENDSLQWLFDTDLSGHSTYEAFESQIDTVIMGNNTYKETKKILGNKPLYPGKEKVVFSRKETGEIEGGCYVTGDPVPIIKILKEENKKAIWIVGGGHLFTQLVEGNMVDEFWIQIAPVLLGKGKRLFENGKYEQRLELIKVTQMGELTELHLKKRNDV